MRVISRIVIVVGLLISIAGNIATYYSARTAVNGMLADLSNGIAPVSWGLTSTYAWCFVSLFGCLLLLVGLVLAAVARSPASV